MSVSPGEAIQVGNKLGVNWRQVSQVEFWQGVNIELEHESIVKGDLELAGIIALDHLKEMPDYYTRLIRMEEGNELR